MATDRAARLEGTLWQPTFVDLIWDTDQVLGPMWRPSGCHQTASQVPCPDVLIRVPVKVACTSASNVPHSCGDAWCMLVLDLPDGICKVRTHGPFSALLMSQPTTGSHTSLESGVCIVTTRISQGYRSQSRGVRPGSRQRILVLVLGGLPRGWSLCLVDYGVCFREPLRFQGMNSVRVESNGRQPTSVLPG